ncbi:MAG: hypothetical protein ABSA71_04240 [Desulfomonilia bacterium]
MIRKKLILHPDEVARALIEGIKRGTFIIIPGADGKFIYFMKRHFPFIVELIMRWGICKAQKGRV